MRDLGRLLIAAAERHPDRAALIDGDIRLTYRDWFEIIARTAGGLRALGLAPGDHLVTVLQNTWQAATLHWACQLSGIITTPINWRAKAAELDHVLRDAAAKAVGFQDVSVDAVADAAGSISRIAVGGAAGGTVSFDDLIGAAPDGAPRAGPDDTSVMLYTSGTTGTGKGVPRRHRAEHAAAIAHIAQTGLADGAVQERTLGVMPLYHTMGVRLLLSMAPIGGCFVCMPRFDAGHALKLLSAESITNLFLVPTLFHQLVHHPDSATLPSGLKLGFAGAAMTDGLLQAVDAAFRPYNLVNHYGSTEIYTFTIAPDARLKLGSAGQAGLNQRIRVIALGSDDPDQRVGAGADGQIIADAESVEAFDGYWRRPDADEKALRAGWYFTGDIGYLDEDGDLFVTGRVDDMILTGGENVLPVEVESVLSLHPAVAEVAVAGLPDDKWGQAVTAFIQTRAEVTDAALDAHCRQSALADFKRPRAYKFVREIPKSPVGKILRRKLIAGEYETAVRQD